jgi:hypothetical protein
VDRDGVSCRRELFGPGTWIGRILLRPARMKRLDLQGNKTPGSLADDCTAQAGGVHRGADCNRL